MRKPDTSMAWISQRDYETFRKILVDGHNLPATYEEWKHHVQRSIEMLTKQGYVVAKVNVDPERFALWCRECAIPVNSHSCRTYAMAILAAREKD